MARKGFALAVLLAAGRLVHADSNGRILGVARDETGAPLPGVTVDVRGLGGGTDRSVTTDSQGAFDATDLVPGRYRLVFRFPSFGFRIDRS